MKRSFAWFCPILLILAAPSRSALWDWEVFMSAHTVNALVRFEDDLWGGTNGGLFRLHLPTETFEVFTAADGLSSSDIRAMTLDSRGNLILGMGNAYVDVFNLSTHEVTRISDFKLNSKIFRIYSLFNDSGTVYVGTDVGVSRLQFYENWQRYLIEGNFTNLGSFASEIPGKCIHVFDGGLWVGTSQGLARGDLDVLYLESPEGWSNYTTANGLSNNNIAALTVFDGTFYAASSSGLNRLDGSSFDSLQISNSSGITFLNAHEDTLYYGRSGGIYRWQGSEGIRIGSTQAKGLALEFAVDGTKWAGLQVESGRWGGLRKFQGDDWVYYAPEGLRFEIIADILIDGPNSLWVGGSQGAGFSSGGLAHFDGQHWLNLTRQDDANAQGDSISPNSFFWYGIRALTLDQNGDLWVASDGRGAGWFHYDDQADTVLGQGYYTSDPNRLVGIWTAPSFCVARDLLTDDFGNVWICNSEADPDLGRPIAIVPADFIQDSAAFPNWEHLTITDQGGSAIADAEYQVDRIAQDSFGHKWFGANNNTGRGVWVLDDNGTLSDVDDYWTQLSGLPSDSITALVCDQDGIMWVGTPAGVQYFYPAEDPLQLQGIDLLYLPLGQSIRSIAVDPQNNKWFGTTAGVSILSSDNFTWLQSYTSLDGSYPSPLPGDVVQAIAFDPWQGYAYLGTDRGLARLQTPYRERGFTISSFTISQNPFLIGAGQDNLLQFSDSTLAPDTEIKIFTTAGFLVRHLTSLQVSGGWNGRNSRNELVGTGIYLLLAYSSDGSAAVAKVAVVRQ